jgi:hypothetical protein
MKIIHKVASELSSGTSTDVGAVESGCAFDILCDEEEEEEGDSAEFAIEFSKPCDSGASTTIPHNKHN